MGRSARHDEWRRSERLQVYVEFSSSTQRLWAVTLELLAVPPEGDAGALIDAVQAAVIESGKALSAITLLGPDDVEAAARELWNQSVDLGTAAMDSDRRAELGVQDQEWSDELEQAEDSVLALMSAALKQH
jgi:hypothetical protein